MSLAAKTMAALLTVAGACALSAAASGQYATSARNAGSDQASVAQAPAEPPRPNGSDVNAPDDNAGGNSTDGANASRKPQARRMEQGEYRSSALMGATVVTSNGREIGKVDDIVVTVEHEPPVKVIVAVGGLLGIGERLVSLPLEQLKIEHDDSGGTDKIARVRLELDVDGVRAQPIFLYEGSGEAP